MSSGLSLNRCCRILKKVEELPPTLAKSSTPSLFFSRVAFNGACCPIPSRLGRRCIMCFINQAKGHTWKRRNGRQQTHVRASGDKHSLLIAAILDNHSVKFDPHGGELTCYADRRIKGRGRDLLVDALGLPLAVCVTSTSRGDYTLVPRNFWREHWVS